MDFLKELLVIQHKETLEKVSTIIKNDIFETQEFYNKFNKQNYCAVKLCNCKMKKCVKLPDLFYRLECDHTPSLC